MTLCFLAKPRTLCHTASVAKRADKQTGTTKKRPRWCAIFIFSFDMLLSCLFYLFLSLCPPQPVITRGGGAILCLFV